jgi:hypothetical protein
MVRRLAPQLLRVITCRKLAISWRLLTFHRSQATIRVCRRCERGFSTRFALSQHRTIDHQHGIDRADTPTEFVGRGERYDQTVQDVVQGAAYGGWVVDGG